MRGQANYISRAVGGSSQRGLSPVMKNAASTAGVAQKSGRVRHHRSKSPGGLSSQGGVDNGNSLQRSLKILSLLDGSSSLNQALQMSQSGMLPLHANSKGTPQMMVHPQSTLSQPGGTSLQLDSESMPAERSTWRSGALNGGTITSNN